MLHLIDLQLLAVLDARILTLKVSQPDNNPLLIYVRPGRVTINLVYFITFHSIYIARCNLYMTTSTPMA